MSRLHSRRLSKTNWPIARLYNPSVTKTPPVICVRFMQMLKILGSKLSPQLHQKHAAALKTSCLHEDFGDF